MTTSLTVRPRAFLAGGRYGMSCIGSCWMLMVLLIAFGTMQLAWMLASTVLIWLEKVAFVRELASLTKSLRWTTVR
ncbi:copper chaperone [Mycobacterium simulans]|uniref:copper chaperone n=1 Tax=Mycobacterium simulans TaxID=627089 RepID=UPI0037CC83E1